MKDATGKTVWNLYAREERGRVYLELPDPDGNIDLASRTTGHAVSWPVNPHFTGFTGIVEQLQRFPNWAGKEFVRA